MKIGICSACHGTGHWHYRGEIPKVAEYPLRCPSCHGMGYWADLTWGGFGVTIVIFFGVMIVILAIVCLVFEFLARLFR